MARMKKDIKKRWLKALRSGEFKQGSGALRTTSDEFCCLGVLCELAVQDGVVESTPSHGRDYLYGKGMHTAYPPPEVLEWAGLDTADHAVAVRTKDNPYRTLASLNDSGASFKEVAAVISQRL
jgi:hypothetical protein